MSVLMKTGNRNYQFLTPNSSLLILQKGVSMKKSVLYALWGGLFSICAGLGFIPEPAGFLRVLMTVLSVACFVPPAALLYRAAQSGDRHTLRLVRNLSALSLGLTLAVLVLNVLCAVRA